MVLMGMIVGTSGMFAQSDSLRVSDHILKFILAQEELATYDIPDDIITNLSLNPGVLKRPGMVQKKKTEGAVQKRQGFRIQVFSDGRNPATLQARAQARGNAIVARFPKYRGQVYSFSSAPNWYTRIGNFKTSDEANEALMELKRAFPSFAAEMRVVKSQITIIK